MGKFAASQKELDEMKLSDLSFNINKLKKEYNLKRIEWLNTMNLDQSDNIFQDLIKVNVEVNDLKKIYKILRHEYICKYES